MECTNILNYHNVSFALGCYSEISNLELVVFTFQENVFRLKISMNYILFMEILKAHQCLNYESFHSLFCKFSFKISDIDL